METSEARERFAGARVAHLATVGPNATPHIVPITFALLDERTIVTAVDAKPKRTLELQRLANIRANPAASVMVDHYEERWPALWWVRADGHARVREPGVGDEFRAAALEALGAKYGQYSEAPPAGAVIVLAVDRWSSWRARE